MRCLTLTLLLLLLTACAPNDTTRLALANPASLNCTQRGGKLLIRESNAASKGYCMLADGRSLDVWEYYRQTHP